eukprot:TRINITY_DN67638_c6_g1_i1.p1 TRINITY_DN67638_c6_g1~~TRINITY_DN67638_c6_g1_i1.p1  ORF type:complete len:111 (-),score=1.59 TRINITY_DN67638_c6_g1_i1:305-637(-)
MPRGSKAPTFTENEKIMLRCVVHFTWYRNGKTNPWASVKWSRWCDFEKYLADHKPDAKPSVRKWAWRMANLLIKRGVLMKRGCGYTNGVGFDPTFRDLKWWQRNKDKVLA